MKPRNPQAQILRAAATLPPAEARRILAVMAKSAPAKPTAEELIRQSQEAMEAAMGEAVIAMLEEFFTQEEP